MSYLSQNGYNNDSTVSTSKHSNYNQGAINYHKGQQNQIKGSHQMDQGRAKIEQGQMQK